MVIDGNAATGAGGGSCTSTPATSCSIKNSTVARERVGLVDRRRHLDEQRRRAGDGQRDRRSGNTAGTNGGGLTWAGTASATPPAGFIPDVPVIANSTFDGNLATTSGGALAVSSLGAANTLLILNTALTGNAALGTSGERRGLVQTGGTAGSSLAPVANSTVVGNTATRPAAAVAVTAGAATFNVLNSTIVGNKAGATAENTGGGGIARTTTTDGRSQHRQLGDRRQHERRPRPDVPASWPGSSRTPS